MGQYHTPVCIEAEEALDQYKVACGAKEGEQGYTRPGVPGRLCRCVVGLPSIATSTSGKPPRSLTGSCTARGGTQISSAAARSHGLPAASASSR